MSARRAGTPTNIATLLALGRALRKLRLGDRASRHPTPAAAKRSALLEPAPTSQPKMGLISTSSHRGDECFRASEKAKALSGGNRTGRAIQPLAWYQKDTRFDIQNKPRRQGDNIVHIQRFRHHNDDDRDNNRDHQGRDWTRNRHRRYCHHHQHRWQLLVCL